MAVREIKTRLSLDGEREFTAALKAAEREMRALDSEMKLAAANFDATGDAQQLLGTRSRVLNQQMQQQRAIVQSLEQALADSAQKYGEADRRTDGYRIKLNNARATLVRLEKQLEDTDKEAEELGRDSRRVGQQIENGIGDAADDTRDKLADMFDTIRQDVGTIRGSVVFDVASNVAGEVQNIFSQLASIADGTRETRQRISMLNFNAREAGFVDEQVTMMRMLVTSMIGDEDAAVEGISNLIKSGMDWAELQRAVYTLLGAWVKSPGTMTFESMADSIQEIVASGEVTGQFEEFLSRTGVDMEEFRTAIENAGNEAARLQILNGYIESSGMAEYFDKYRTDEINQALMEAQEAEALMQEQMNALAANIDELFLTDLKNFGVDVMEVVNGALGEINDNGLWATISGKIDSAKQALDAYWREAEEIYRETDKLTGDSQNALMQGEIVSEIEIRNDQKGTLSGLYDEAMAAGDTEAAAGYQAQIDMIEKMNEASEEELAARAAYEAQVNETRLAAVASEKSAYDTTAGNLSAMASQIESEIATLTETRDGLLAQASAARAGGDESSAAEYDAAAASVTRMLSERTAELEQYKLAEDALTQQTTADMQARINELAAEREQLEALMAQKTEEGDTAGAAAIQTRLDAIATEIAAREAVMEQIGNGVGESAANGIADGIADGGVAMTNAADNASASAMNRLVANLEAGGARAESTAWGTADSINAAFASIDVSPVYNALASASRAAGTASRTSGSINVALNVSGRQIAQASLPYTDRMLGGRATA